MLAKVVAKHWFKLACQGGFLLLVNGNFGFFSTKSIYQGPLKNFCVPVLHCHSCPLSLYACPVGAMQYFFTTGRFPVYIVSTIAAIGLAIGRMPCGLLCPFGFLQDFIFKLGIVRREVPRMLLGLKYAVLAALVVVLPAMFALPAFCKICPAAVLEAGFPLAFLDEHVWNRLYSLEGGFSGWTFLLKTVFLTAVLVAAASIKRPFCRIICPLGALLGLFNRFSLLSLVVDRDTCNNCGRCARLCPVDINVSENPDSAECVRCLQCTSCESVAAVIRLLPVPVKQHG